MKKDITIPTDISIEDFRSSCHRRMIEKYGKIVPAYILTMINQACEQLDIYQKAQEEVKTYGLVLESDKGRRYKNPAIGIAQDSLSQFRSLLTQLILTPNAQDKLHYSDKGEQNMLLSDLLGK